MTRPSLPLDLLQERRRQRGLPPLPARSRPARQLLLGGAAIGSALVAVVLLLSLGLAWRQQ